MKAFAPTPRTVDSDAPVLWVFVSEPKGPWQKGLLGIHNMFGMLAQVCSQYWVGGLWGELSGEC